MMFQYSNGIPRSEVGDTIQTYRMSLCHEYIQTTKDEQILGND